MFRRVRASWLWLAPFAALAVAGFALFALRSPLFWWYEAVPVAVFLIALYRCFTSAAAVQLQYAGLMVWCVAVASAPFLYAGSLAAH